jgi:hypothetical protein
MAEASMLKRFFLLMEEAVSMSLPEDELLCLQQQ